jgi:DNA-binding SARP family transcriptional activator
LKQIESHELTLKANFFGDFSISINGYPLVEISSQKARGLFAYLLLEKNQLKTRSSLASIFWPDVPDQTALHNLRQALTTIKKAISETIEDVEIFSSDRDTLALNENVDIQVDILAFENTIQILLDRHNGQSACGFPIYQLKKTMSFANGEILPLLTFPDSDLFEDWLILKREKNNRLKVSGYSILLKYFESRGEWGKARKIAEDLLTIAPWDEDIHTRLIRILLQSSQANAALSHYHSAVRYLKSSLDLEPGLLLQNAYTDIQKFLSSGIIQKSWIRLLKNLPGYATPFVGRDNELIVLENWISNAHHQVITITGPGGCGKTRLAVELANLQNTLFKDGVYFVSIEGCLTLEHLCLTIMSALGNSVEHQSNSIEELLEWAKNRCALLVLDNVDNLEETALLAKQLTETAPSIVLLFTSYTFLNLVGEKVLALGGLSTREGEQSDAAKLFYSHLQVESLPEINDPDFSSSVIKICDLVEGFPLAIDLAACQTKWTPIGEIWNDLQASIKILSTNSINIPERHRSIQASFENVWQRLSDQEQLLIFRLTIFENPFTVKAAQSVCEVNNAVLEDFSRRALLIWDGQEHYRFHRVVKQNIREKYKLSEGDQTLLAERHAVWFYRQSLYFYKEFKGNDAIKFHKGIERVLSDIVKGINWFSHTKNWNYVNDLIIPLNDYFENLCLYREGVKTFEKLLEKFADDDQNLLCRAKITCRIALFGLNIQQYENAAEMIHFGLDTARKLELKNDEAYCLNALSTHAIKCKNASTAIEFALEALELSRLNQNTEEESHSLYNLGYAQVNLGEISAAEQNLNACRLLCEKSENWQLLSKGLNVLADIACYRGDYDLALTHYEQALLIVRSSKNLYSESLLLNNMGTAYLELKNYLEAIDYFSKSLDICRQIGDREGESIALSNLGETAAYQKDFENAIFYNDQALAIAEEIESDWSILAARIVLAEAYREGSDILAAKNELILLLNKSCEMEAMNFFHRGVVEACRLLIHTGNQEDLASVLEVTMNAEGAEESTRLKAKKTRDKLTEKLTGKQQLDIQSIYSILKERLNQIS